MTISSGHNTNVGELPGDLGEHDPRRMAHPIGNEPGSGGHEVKPNSAEALGKSEEPVAAHGDHDRFNPGRDNTAEHAFEGGSSETMDRAKRQTHGGLRENDPEPTSRAGHQQQSNPLHHDHQHGHQHGAGQGYDGTSSNRLPGQGHEGSSVVGGLAQEATGHHGHQHGVGQGYEGNSSNRLPGQGYEGASSIGGLGQDSTTSHHGHHHGAGQGYDGTSSIRGPGQEGNFLRDQESRHQPTSGLHGQHQEQPLGGFGGSGSGLTGNSGSGLTGHSGSGLTSNSGSGLTGGRDNYQSGNEPLSGHSGSGLTGHSGSGLTGGRDNYQSGNEPLSGHRGAGVGGEPYDAGNFQEPGIGGSAPQHSSHFGGGHNTRAGELLDPASGKETGIPGYNAGRQ